VVESDQVLRRRKRRKVYSVEEKKKLCQQWKCSGLSLHQFCEQQNLAKSSFYGWCQRYGTDEVTESAFSPVTAPASSQEIVQNHVTIELLLSTGTPLRLSFREDKLIDFLQELMYATNVIR